MERTINSFVFDNSEDYLLENHKNDTVLLEDPRLWTWLNKSEPQGIMNEDFIEFFTI